MPAVMALLVSVSYMVVGAWEPALASEPLFVLPVALIVLACLIRHQTHRDRSEA